VTAEGCAVKGRNAVRRESDVDFSPEPINERMVSQTVSRGA
jgi:hypothetical protein